MKFLALFLLRLTAGVLLVVSAQEFCPPQYPTISGAVTIPEYKAAREACTLECNNAGYCCTLGYGGCNQVPCNTGCHIAFFLDNVAACKAECASANMDDDGRPCYYTHARHADTGDLGFNPAYPYAGVATCVGSETCGCPVLDPGMQNWGTAQPNECSSAACNKGCDLASSLGAKHNFFNGPDVEIDYTGGLDQDALIGALNALKSHSSGSVLSSKAEIEAYIADISMNKALLETNLTLIEKAMDLVDAYETNQGPLFMNSKTTGGFTRTLSSNDGKEFERAMLVVQQAILDVIYHGSLVDFVVEDKQTPSIIGPCLSILEGRKWKTAAYFPGDVTPPTEKTVVYTVLINATMGPCWGGPVAFCDQPSIRPTGLYLSPGEIANVKVPESMVGNGFKIQVGASTINNQDKEWHLRMDRVTTTFDVKQTTTYVGNPLGGGLYIRVPYLGNSGVVTVEISGGVVKAPIFQNTSLHITSSSEWSNFRTAPGPWADFETDTFLLQVPRIWMYDYGYSEISNLLSAYDKAMDGVSELCGYFPDERNNYVAYVAPDLHIKHGAYGIGYPQVNNQVSAGPSGITENGPAGKSTHWFLTRPYGDDTFYHELGHQQMQTRYRGETEAQVNLLITYVQNVKFGIDLDNAFIASFPRTGTHTVDAAAISWMVKENYRLGNEMDYSNTIYDEFRYQHRGYAKYADIARLFGWKAVSDMYRQEHLDAIYDNPNPCPGLADSDYRTFKFSRQVGVNLTPIIHFWGIHPVDSQLLQQCMDKNGLNPSEAVEQQLLRYATIVPVTQQDFIDHFNEVLPGTKDCDSCCPSEIYGCGWYNVWYPKWSETTSADAIATTMNIVELYFPRPLPSSEPSAIPSKGPSPAPAPVPCLNTNGNVWCSKRLSRCATTLSGCDLACGKCSLPTAAPTPKCLGNTSRCGSGSECCSGLCNSRGKCASSRLLRNLVSGGKFPSFKGGPPGLDRAEIQGKLNGARGKWKSKAIKNYDFELWRDFFGKQELLGPFIIKVRNNKVISTRYKSTGRDVDDEVLRELPRTIDELYDLIHFESNQNIDNMDVVYSDEDGYPTQVFVARAENDSEEGAQAFFIRNFGNLK